LNRKGDCRNAVMEHEATSGRALRANVIHEEQTPIKLELRSCTKAIITPRRVRKMGRTPLPGTSALNCVRKQGNDWSAQIAGDLY